ncbi:hypothetical protein BBJ28_00001299 [Nothophytophthora sp. Chile5]|nr:hypothetical protein BBJ28_00001299 [Nothophytophthora sp. Chile5]
MEPNGGGSLEAPDEAPRPQLARRGADASRSTKVSAFSTSPIDSPTMRRSISHGPSGDVALRELERALDAFMATHVVTAASSLAVAAHTTNSSNGGPALGLNAGKFGVEDEGKGQQMTSKEVSTDAACFRRDLARLQCLCQVIASTRRRGNSSIVGVGRALLAWLQAVESSSAAAAASSNAETSASPPLSATEAARAAEQTQQESSTDPVASWLVATLLQVVFQAAKEAWSLELTSTNPINDVVFEDLVGCAVDRCLLAFQRAWHADEEAQRRARAESSGAFFAFTQHLTMRKPKVKSKLKVSTTPLTALAVCLACSTQAATVWSCVLGFAACLVPDVSRLKLQQEILALVAVWNAAKTSAEGNSLHHSYLKHLTHVHLGLASTGAHPCSTAASRVSEATLWLRALLPLLLKPHRSHVRGACAQLVAQMLTRELRLLSRQELGALYATTGGDWSRCVSDLHAAALRLTDCAKKKSRSRMHQLETSAWALRAVVLALAPGEIFARYWREDALALLRLQYQFNQDATGCGASSFGVLPSLALSFTFLLHRHFLSRISGVSGAGAPSETDCMEIINTTQAWVFFSFPRLRLNTAGSSSFPAFRVTALPALVHISRAIAGYNTAYVVQSHLRRLLAEPVGVGNPQKLIGLEVLANLLACCQADSEPQTDGLPSFHVGHKELLAGKQALGELVGHVLLECSTRMGHELATETVTTTDKLDVMRSDQYRSEEGGDEDEQHGKDPTQAVAVATFAAALGLLPPLYTHLGLSSKQKLLLLVHASVNTERVVHCRAHQALLTLIGPLDSTSETPPPGAATVVRALTDYIMQTPVSGSTSASNAPGAIIILRLLGVLLSSTRATITRWESARARLEGLTQVEAAAVYLLAKGDDNLEAGRKLRLAALDTLEVAHEARVDYCEAGTTSTSTLLSLAGRPSVWTLLGDLTSELQAMFFSFGLDSNSSTSNNLQEKAMVTNDKPLEVLRCLIADRTARRSFRWSLCLARIFRCLARRASDVTTYIWTDVADRVAKLEPVVAVTVIVGDLPQHQQSQRELARWRNLSLLATASACPSLPAQARKPATSSFSSETSSFSSSTVPSVAPTAMVASLVRQLACYLRSTSVEQRNAAVLALGHANTLALPILLDVLARYEGEAFTSSSNGEDDSTEAISPSPTSSRRSRGTKTMKVSRKKLLELQHARAAQFTLQWALGRCYRLLLENRARGQHDDDDPEPGGPMDERLRLAAWSFLAKMAATFEGIATASVGLSGVDEACSSLSPALLTTEANHPFFMVQQDFIASVRALLLLHPSPGVKPTAQLSFEKLVNLLLGWCGSFDVYLADAALSSHLHSGFVTTEVDPGLNNHWMRLCDVHAAHDGALIFPWLWIDDQHQLLGSGGVATASEACVASRRMTQYFTCHRAFSTVAELLRNSLETPGGNEAWNFDGVFLWLDACFSMDASAFPHFIALQQLAHRALHALLELPAGRARFCHVVTRCLEKAVSVFACPEDGIKKPRLRVARQYLAALGASAEIMRFFRRLLLRLQDQSDGRQIEQEEAPLAMRLLHVLLLHVGVELDDECSHQHRQAALDMVAALICETEARADDDDAAAARWSLQDYYSPSLTAQVAGRLQISVSALLAAKFPVLSQRMSLAVLRSLSQTLVDHADFTQQRQVLAAVLPWLAEVDLQLPNVRGSKSTELLELLFVLTAVLSESCSEQLDHIWLTLAFASTGSGDANLEEVVSFLFRQQRQNQQSSATAKTVVWWLCRWQDAASDVLRLLLLQYPLASATTDRSESPSALEDLAALVALAGDSSCHLLQPSTGASNTHVRALAVHLVHVALTTLFTLLDGGNLDRENAPDGVARNCHVLLHAVLPLLEAPRGLLASALAQIRDTTSTDAATANTGERDWRSQAMKKQLRLERFQEALRALGSCMSSTEIQLWSDLCIRNIALAITTETPTSPEAPETLASPPSPPEICVRFALIAYGQLPSPFHGDVLLSTLTLLRQALATDIEDDRQVSQGRRPSRLQSLARECLTLLAVLTRRMPASRLVLYPQVLWVALALLTYCRQQRVTTEDSVTLHNEALELLAALLDRVPLLRHDVLQDLARCTRPEQWGNRSAGSSLLLELVRSTYTSGGSRSRALALDMLCKSVLLVPRDLLGVSSREHLIICTLGLLPALVESSNTEEGEVSVKTCAWDDLAALWQSTGSSPACDRMEELLRVQGRTNDVDGGDSHMLAATLMTAFVSAVCTLELEDDGSIGDFDGVGLSLEVLVASLPQPVGARKNGEEARDGEEDDERGEWVLVLLEELLREIQRSAEATTRACRPVPALEAALARLLRSPRSEEQWRAAVRVLNCVTEMAKPAKAFKSLPSSKPASPAGRRSLPGGMIESSVPLERIKEAGDVRATSSPKNSPRTLAAAETPTLKKSPSTRTLLQFMTARSRSSSSISKSTRNEGNNYNNHNDPSWLHERSSIKDQHSSECSEDHEHHMPPDNAQPTPEGRT